MTSERPVARVLLSEDTSFYRTRLSTVIEEDGHQAVKCEGDDLVGALEAVGPPLALIIVPLYPRPEEMLEALRRASELEWLSTVPILGISASSLHGLDLWQLRALGVVGVVDRHSLPEHVRFRVSQLLFGGKGARVNRRALCDFPVKVVIEGETNTARAITLSEGGMGLSCDCAIEVNTKVTVHFGMPAQGGEIHQAEGRIVHSRVVARPERRYELGLFFYPQEPAFHRAMATEVARLLATER